MSSINLNPDPSFLADNIRILRKSRNWSQEELAKQVGLNRGNIASYEKGTAEPKLCNLLKIAQLFGVSILDLMESEDMKPEMSGNGTTNLPSSGMEPETWAKLVEHAEELERVTDGIFHCHCFKMKLIARDDDKDLKTISNQFEQLYDATRSLLKSHKELLAYLGARELPLK
ncbi:MAG: helix-turn-helix transcriptional regulator [Saprospirales bacterium]|nr:helix-turn-helix transcriptional regulator [Saprospirales bacterium]MBK6901388.1 helix-turn-helix transcriptional regulator [Saprospirales bacterium]MBK6903033.1 helix-turn-helix transcriptional regulator [Saprospirales bacterium]MBK7336053.1 helix-turn-helix transcriptional regulator [Saprospirales bacterium]